VTLFIPKNHSFFAHFINKNTLELNIQDRVELEQLRLHLSISATDYEDEVIFDGTTKHRIPKGYGENDWTVEYKGKPMGTFRHFKKNNWHDHHYIFNLYEYEGTIKCDIKIKGPDEDKATLTISVN